MKTCLDHEITTALLRSSSTYFEDFSNEIIFEIFDFLDTYHIYKGFLNLNLRFNNLLNDSTLPIKINTSYISKSDFQNYHTQFILPNIDRVSSLQLSNSCVTTLICPSSENIQQLTGLKTLILDHVVSNDFLNRLTILPKLSSLIINECEQNSNVYIDYHSILRLPVLKYCKLSYKGDFFSKSSSDDTHKSSPIERLVIKSEFDLNKLDILLSYVPDLRYLSIDYLSVNHFLNFNSPTEAIVPSKLTHASLKLNNIEFDEFEKFLLDFGRKLQRLRISVSNDLAYIDANRWEQLISSAMVHLQTFDIQYSYEITSNSNDKVTYNELIQRFTSVFWIERQWYFGHQYYEKERSTCGMFYSLQPYRRRDYILYSKHKSLGYSFHFDKNYDSVRHVSIENQLTTDNYSVYFPNATELTLNGDCNTFYDAVKHLLPLNQLQKININCRYVSFQTLVDVLSHTPSCCVLILNSISCNNGNYRLLERDSIFRSVSNTNKIKNLTIKSICTIDDVKLLTKLCPRLQHLTIEVQHKVFQQSLQLLLSATNKSDQYLSSLSIGSTEDIWLEKVMNMLKTLRRSNQFHVQEINYYRCYIYC